MQWERISWSVVNFCGQMDECDPYEFVQLAWLRCKDIPNSGLVHDHQRPELISGLPINVSHIRRSLLHFRRFILRHILRLKSPFDSWTARKQFGVCFTLGIECPNFAGSDLFSGTIHWQDFSITPIGNKLCLNEGLLNQRWATGACAR